MKVKIPPLSINKCWQGKRFKTKTYKEWREQFYYLALPDQFFKEKINEPCEVFLDFYIKNFKLADVDNFIKPTFDAMVESGLIEDDRLIICVNAKKHKVKNKEDEMLEIRINKNINI